MMKQKFLTVLLTLVLLVCVLPMVVQAEGTECAHASQISYTAKTANCCTNGNEAYSQCSDCGALFDESGGAITSVPTTTDPGNHTNIYTVGETEGNCCFPGTAAHKKCGGCGKLFDLEGNGIPSVPNTEREPDKHTAIVTVPATTPTCCTTGTEAHQKCNGCGKLFNTAGEPISAPATIPMDTSNHSNYIAPINAVNATCCSYGNIAHYRCSGCGKLFRQENGSESITSEDTKLPFDPNNHGDNISDISAVPATCCSTGNEAYARCSGCGKLFKDKTGAEKLDEIPTIGINGNNHSSIEVIDEEPATCCNTGTAKHKKCVGCGKLFDMNDAPIASAEKLPVAANNHSQLNPVAEIPANCAVGGVAAHYKCGGCGKLFADKEGEDSLAAAPKTNPNAANHAQLNPVAEIPANCAVGGVAAHYKCGGCGKLFEDANGKKPLDALPATSPDSTNHSKLNPVAEVPATCTENGVAAHYKCGGCGKLFSDEEGSNAITAPEVLSPDANAHSWNNGVVTKQPTCTTKGTKRFTCIYNSEHYYDQDVAVVSTAHDWDAGKVTTTATCISKGIKTYTCKNDATHTYTEEDPATGNHDYSVLSHDHKYHTYTCSTKGCTAHITDRHHFSRWKVIRYASSSHPGLKYKYCKDCGYEIYKKVYFTTNPKTGDTTALVYGMMLFSGTGLASAAALYKKKKK